MRKQGLLDPKAESFRDHEAKPLAHHLDAWHRDMVAKGKTAEHADLSRDRAAKLIAMVKGVSLDKLAPGRKADAMAQAAQLLANTLEQARFNNRKEITVRRVHSLAILLAISWVSAVSSQPQATKVDFNRSRRENLPNWSGEKPLSKPALLNDGLFDAMLSLTVPLGRTGAPLEKGANDTIQAKRQEASTSFRANASKDISAILTKAQRVDYERMLGKPYDIRLTWS